MTTGHSNKKLAAAEFRRLVDRNISNQLEALRETPPPAVCQGHTVKPQKPTANPLPCAAHGNQGSAKPAFAVCYISGTRQRVCRVQLSTHGKKKLPPRNDDVARTLPCALLAWHTAKFKSLPCATVFAHGKDWHLCRVPWFLHTAKVPEPIFFV